MAKACRFRGIANRRRWALFLGTAATTGMLTSGSLARAATCVSIDESRDNLTQADRDGARTLFEEALQESGIPAARDNCSETWTLYHVKLGSSVTVVVHSPRGDRKETAAGLKDLPGVYSQVVRSIQTGLIGSSESPVVDRKNVTDSQTTPNQLPADSIWYLNLGYGATAGAEYRGGPAIGFGKRWELDRVAIDLSFLNLAFYQGNNGSEGASAGWVKLGADYFFDAYANYSPYVGAGLSLSSNDVHVQSTNNTASYDYSGWGLNAELTAGYELFRASTIRMLLQANLSLPTYRMTAHPYTLSASGISMNATESRYAPVFGISVGIGWGKPREVAVVKVQE